MKKLISLLLLTALLIVPLAACGSKSKDQDTSAKDLGSARKGGTLIVGLSGDPSSFNPDTIPDDYTYMVAENVFSRLVKINSKNEIIPDLAKSWSISDDGKTYTFVLNEGIKWHDGQPFSSADVKWTFDAIVKNSGYLAVNLTNLDSITTPNDNTVVFHLKTSDATLLSSLSFLGAFILPKHIFEGTDWTTNPAVQQPVGTGPFKFEEYQKGVSISLSANKDYFQGEPKVDKLIYKIITDGNTALMAFHNGELDILGITPSLSEVASLEGTNGVKLVKVSTTTRFYATFNMTKEPFNKQEVREAFALAINRQDVVDKVFKGVGQVAKGFYTPNISWAYNDTAVLPERDLEKARSLLEQAGYQKDKDGHYFNVIITTFNITPYPDIATVLKSNLEEIGIGVTVNVMEQAAWMQKCLIDRDFEISLMGGSVGPDPSALFNRVGSNGALNFTSYSNATIDRLFTEGGAIINQEDRAVKYKEIQKILAEELPFVPLVDNVSVNVYKDYLTGLPFDDAIDKTGLYEYTYVNIHK